MKPAVVGVVAIVAALALGAAVRRPSGEAPPELAVGRTVMVDWTGSGAMRGEVLQVAGPWVKLKFGESMTNNGGQDVSLVSEPWVNFDRLTYYLSTANK